MIRSIRFNVHYGTRPNQNIILVGNTHLFGEWDLKRGLRLGHAGEGQWMLEVILSTATIPSDIEYKFVLVDDSNGSVFWEAGPNRLIDTKYSVVSNGVLELRDIFQAGNMPEFTWLDTTLFEDVVFLREGEKILDRATVYGTGCSLELRVLAQAVEPDHQVYVFGNIDALGGWNTSKAVPLTYIGKSKWAVTIQFDESKLAYFEYKYFICNPSKLSDREQIIWEDGGNRVFKKAGHCPFKTSVEVTPSTPSSIRTSEIFRRQVNWRASGIAVPIFSLRTEKGLGVGEFLDLIPLVDFCSSIGSRMIQILPVNDTSCFLTWRDSYPYSSLSVFALHPIYLRLSALTDNKSILTRIEAESTTLNKLPQIDYEAVIKVKNELSKEIFKLEGKRDAKGVALFVEQNKEWLIPYSVFCALRDEYGTAEYSTWPEYSKPQKQEIFDLYEKLVKDEKSGVQWTNWIQFNLHHQLAEASNYAAHHRVGLKGDLPIGVNRVSVDSWLNHDLFHMTMSTGAPPDQFSEDGQNWGFPTYDWEKMSQDNYSWWRQRLTQMAQYFHAFRIDHILGFFRIWEIPVAHSSGMMGHYNPSIAIHRHQLENAGIWDIRRLVEPHIRWDLVHRIAHLTHEEIQQVVSIFLDAVGNDRYTFKSEYDTDAKITAYLDTLPDDTTEASRWKTKLTRTLTTLQRNVILLPHPTDPDLFYPRVNFPSNFSYHELQADWKHRLYQFYVNYFYGNDQEEYWRQIGSARLPVIRSATRMLVCGEDLGMVPKCVEPVMHDLGIVGLRVQRMPPDPKIAFGLPHTYNHLTVCTPSSHDTSTIRGWWEEDRAKTVQFYRNVLHRHDDVPVYCEPWIVESILSQHFHSPSMLAVFPIQDLLGIEPSLRVNDPDSEKINEPSNPKHYWRYRMHVTLESLKANTAFIDRIAAFNASSGRS